MGNEFWNKEEKTVSKALSDRGERLIASPEDEARSLLIAPFLIPTYVRMGENNYQRQLPNMQVHTGSL